MADGLILIVVLLVCCSHVQEYVVQPHSMHVIAESGSTESISQRPHASFQTKHEKVQSNDNFYVDDSAGNDVSNDCQSQTSACQTFNVALSKSWEVALINNYYVGSGTYNFLGTETNTFLSSESWSIYGKDDLSTVFVQSLPPTAAVNHVFNVSSSSSFLLSQVTLTLNHPLAEIQSYFLRMTASTATATIDNCVLILNDYARLAQFQYGRFYLQNTKIKDLDFAGFLLFPYGASQTFIKNITVDNVNSSFSAGVIVYMNTNNYQINVTVQESTFKGMVGSSTLHYAGYLFSLQGINNNVFLFDDNTFENIDGKSNYGGVFCLQGTSLSIFRVSNCVFQNVSLTDGYGGVIFSSLTSAGGYGKGFIACNFTLCSAMAGGVAFLNTDTANGILQFLDCKFLNNTGIGNDVYMQGQADTYSFGTKLGSCSTSDEPRSNRVLDFFPLCYRYVKSTGTDTGTSASSSSAQCGLSPIAPCRTLDYTIENYYKYQDYSEEIVVLDDVDFVARNFDQSGSSTAWLFLTITGDAETEHHTVTAPSQVNGWGIGVDIGYLHMRHLKIVHTGGNSVDDSLTVNDDITYQDAYPLFFLYYYSFFYFNDVIFTTGSTAVSNPFFYLTWEEDLPPCQLYLTNCLFTDIQTSCLSLIYDYGGDTIVNITACVFRNITSTSENWPTVYSSYVMDDVYNVSFFYCVFNEISTSAAVGGLMYISTSTDQDPVFVFHGCNVSHITGTGTDQEGLVMKVEFGISVISYSIFEFIKKGQNGGVISAASYFHGGLQVGYSVFKSVEASGNGGSIYLTLGTPYLLGVDFINNTADGTGNDLYSEHSESTYFNSLYIIGCCSSSFSCPAPASFTDTGFVIKPYCPSSPSVQFFVQNLPTADELLLGAESSARCPDLPAAGALGASPLRRPNDSLCANVISTGEDNVYPCGRHCFLDYTGLCADECGSLSEPNNNTGKCDLIACSLRPPAGEDDNTIYRCYSNDCYYHTKNPTLCTTDLCDSFEISEPKGVCVNLPCEERAANLINAPDSIMCGVDVPCYYFPKFSEYTSVDGGTFTQCTTTCPDNYDSIQQPSGTPARYYCEAKECTSRDSTKGCRLPDDTTLNSCYLHNTDCVTSCPAGTDHTPEGICVTLVIVSTETGVGSDTRNCGILAEACVTIARGLEVSSSIHHVAIEISGSTYAATSTTISGGRIIFITVHTPTGTATPTTPTTVFTHQADSSSALFIVENADVELELLKILHNAATTGVLALLNNAAANFTLENCIVTGSASGGAATAAPYALVAVANASLGGRVVFKGGCLVENVTFTDGWSVVQLNSTAGSLSITDTAFSKLNTALATTTLSSWGLLLTAVYYSVNVPTPASHRITLSGVNITDVGLTSRSAAGLIYIGKSTQALVLSDVEIKNIYTSASIASACILRSLGSSSVSFSSVIIDHIGKSSSAGGVGVGKGLFSLGEVEGAVILDTIEIDQVFVSNTATQPVFLSGVYAASLSVSECDIQHIGTTGEPVGAGLVYFTSITSGSVEWRSSNVTSLYQIAGTSSASILEVGSVVGSVTVSGSELTNIGGTVASAKGLFSFTTVTDAVDFNGNTVSSVLLGTGSNTAAVLSVTDAAGVSVRSSSFSQIGNTFSSNLAKGLFNFETITGSVVLEGLNVDLVSLPAGITAAGILFVNAASSVSLTGCEFTHITGTNTGRGLIYLGTVTGAVILDTVKVDVLSLTGSLSSGSVLHVSASSSISISLSNFTNVGTTSIKLGNGLFYGGTIGGSVALSSIVVDRVELVSTALIGVLAVQNAQSVVVTGPSKFWNIGTNIGVGLISIRGTSTASFAVSLHNLLVTNITFSNTVAGGVLALSSSGSITIGNSEFRNISTVAKGGVLAITTCPSVSIFDTIIEKVKALNFGGALFFGSNAVFSIASSTLKECEVTTSGGYGGAIYSESDAAEKFVLDTVTFIDNIAAGGTYRYGQDIADDSTDPLSHYVYGQTIEVLNSVRHCTSTHTVTQNGYLFYPRKLNPVGSTTVVVVFDCMLTDTCPTDTLHVANNGYDFAQCGSVSLPCASLTYLHSIPEKNGAGITILLHEGTFPLTQEYFVSYDSYQASGIRYRGLEVDPENSGFATISSHTVGVYSAFLVFSSALYFENIRIEDNIATLVGEYRGFFILDDGELHLTNVVYTASVGIVNHSVAFILTGNMYLSGCVFKDFSVGRDAGLDHPVLLIFEGQMEVNDTVFSGINSDSHWGIVIDFDWSLSNSLYIRNVTVSDISYTNPSYAVINFFGGNAASPASTANMVIEDSVITNIRIGGTADGYLHPGALDIAQRINSYSIKNTTFSFISSAVAVGGGIYFDSTNLISKANGVVEDCVFLSNRVLYASGVYSRRAPVFLKHCSFINNTKASTSSSAPADVYIYRGYFSDAYYPEYMEGCCSSSPSPRFTESDGGVKNYLDDSSSNPRCPAAVCSNVNQNMASGLTVWSTDSSLYPCGSGCVLDVDDVCKEQCTYWHAAPSGNTQGLCSARPCTERTPYSGSGGDGLCRVSDADACYVYDSATCLTNCVNDTKPFKHNPTGSPNDGVCVWDQCSSRVPYTAGGPGTETCGNDNCVYFKESSAYNTKYTASTTSCTLNCPTNYDEEVVTDGSGVVTRTYCKPKDCDARDYHYCVLPEDGVNTNPDCYIAGESCVATCPGFLSPDPTTKICSDVGCDERSAVGGSCGMDVCYYFADYDKYTAGLYKECNSGCPSNLNYIQTSNASGYYCTEIACESRVQSRGCVLPGDGTGSLPLCYTNGASCVLNCPDYTSGDQAGNTNRVCQNLDCAHRVGTPVTGAAGLGCGTDNCNYFADSGKTGWESYTQCISGSCPPNYVKKSDPASGTALRTYCDPLPCGSRVAASGCVLPMDGFEGAPLCFAHNGVCTTSCPYFFEGDVSSVCTPIACPSRTAVEYEDTPGEWTCGTDSACYYFSDNDTYRPDQHYKQCDTACPSPSNYIPQTSSTRYVCASKPCESRDYSLGCALPSDGTGTIPKCYSVPPSLSGSSSGQCKLQCPPFYSGDQAANAARECTVLACNQRTAVTKTGLSGPTCGTDTSLPCYYFGDSGNAAWNTYKECDGTCPPNYLQDSEKDSSLNPIRYVCTALECSLRTVASGCSLPVDSDSSSSSYPLCFKSADASVTHCFASTCPEFQQPATPGGTVCAWTPCGERSANTTGGADSATCGADSGCNYFADYAQYNSLYTPSTPATECMATCPMNYDSVFVAAGGGKPARFYCKPKTCSGRNAPAGCALPEDGSSAEYPLCYTWDIAKTRCSTTCPEYQQPSSSTGICTFADCNLRTANLTEGSCGSDAAACYYFADNQTDGWGMYNTCEFNFCPPNYEKTVKFSPSGPITGYYCKAFSCKTREAIDGCALPVDTGSSAFPYCYAPDATVSSGTKCVEVCPAFKDPDETDEAVCRWQDCIYRVPLLDTVNDAQVNYTCGSSTSPTCYYLPYASEHTGLGVTECVANCPEGYVNTAVNIGGGLNKYYCKAIQCNLRDPSKGCILPGDGLSDQQPSCYRSATGATYTCVPECPTFMGPNADKACVTLGCSSRQPAEISGVTKCEYNGEEIPACYYYPYHGSDSASLPCNINCPANYQGESIMDAGNHVVGHICASKSCTDRDTASGCVHEGDGMGGVPKCYTPLSLSKCVLECPEHTVEDEGTRACFTQSCVEREAVEIGENRFSCGTDTSPRCYFVENSGAFESQTECALACPNANYDGVEERGDEADSTSLTGYVCKPKTCEERFAQLGCQLPGDSELSTEYPLCYYLDSRRTRCVSSCPAFQAPDPVTQVCVSLECSARSPSADGTCGKDLACYYFSDADSTSGSAWNYPSCDIDCPPNYYKTTKLDRTGTLVGYVCKALSCAERKTQHNCTLPVDGPGSDEYPHCYFPMVSPPDDTACTTACEDFKIPSVGNICHWEECPARTPLQDPTHSAEVAFTCGISTGMEGVTCYYLPHAAEQNPARSQECVANCPVNYENTPTSSGKFYCKAKSCNLRNKASGCYLPGDGVEQPSCYSSDTVPGVCLSECPPFTAPGGADGITCTVLSCVSRSSIAEACGTDMPCYYFPDYAAPVYQSADYAECNSSCPVNYRPTEKRNGVNVLAGYYCQSLSCAERLTSADTCYHPGDGEGSVSKCYNDPFSLDRAHCVSECSVHSTANENSHTCDALPCTSRTGTDRSCGGDTECYYFADAGSTGWYEDYGSCLGNCPPNYKNTSERTSTTRYFCEAIPCTARDTLYGCRTPGDAAGCYAHQGACVESCPGDFTNDDSTSICVAGGGGKAKGKSSSLWWIILVVLIVVAIALVVVIIAFVIYRKRKKDEVQCHVDLHDTDLHELQDIFVPFDNRTDEQDGISAGTDDDDDRLKGVSHKGLDMSNHQAMNNSQVVVLVDDEHRDSMSIQDRDESIPDFSNSGLMGSGENDSQV